MELGEVLSDQLVGKDAVRLYASGRLVVEQIGTSGLVPQNVFQRSATPLVPGAACLSKSVVCHLTGHALCYPERGQPVSAYVNRAAPAIADHWS